MSNISEILYQYQDYQVEIISNDSNKLNIKFTKNTNNIEYSKLIGQEDLPELCINKFKKLLISSIKNTPGYKITINELKTNLQVVLCFESDLLDITQIIFLDKINYTVCEYVSKLETHINKLENNIKQLKMIIQEQNLITIAKILKIESSLQIKELSINTFSNQSPEYTIQIDSITDVYIRYPIALNVTYCYNLL